MARSIIDPVTRIEGHLRIEMEVTNEKVSDAWVSGGCFRGVELAVTNRRPADAVQIVQRICGVCPVSHAHASAIAAEKAFGIQIPNSARIIRNILEGAQFLHSNILWFYNLAALDYVNPIDALNADVADAIDLAAQVKTSNHSDLNAVAKRLTKFAENGQMSIFSGAWFGADEGSAYTLSPELNLLLTSHYLEALGIQAKASQIAAIIGGKMPHVTTLLAGGTAFVPTPQKLDELWALANEVYDWVASTMVQDTVALAPHYADALKWGGNKGRYIAWGVFENKSMDMYERYMPAGIITDDMKLIDVDESKITEYVGNSWYKGSDTYHSPYFVTDPDFTSYDVNDRYSWIKAPAYDGKSYEAGSLARVLVAYMRGVPFITESVNSLLDTLSLQVSDTNSTLGRTAVRQIETLYVATLMKEWVGELIEALKGGDSTYFEKPATTTGEGTGFWEAPRGALYHSEKVTNNTIDGYQIIIPSTWNLAPHGEDGSYGPLEEALIGVPVSDLEMPINALRTVHSMDPCTACAVHITEPATGKKFKTITSPWGSR